MIGLPSARPLRLIAGAASAAVALGASAVAMASAPHHAYNFVSEPGLHPPRLQVLERKHGLARGDFLVTTFGAGGRRQAGPLIVDSRARPVWFLPGRAPAEDFEQETYHGKPVLVFTRGRAIDVLNEHYRTIARLKAHQPWAIDGHDAQIIGGRIWVTVVREVAANLTQYGGPANGTVLDCGVQEYALKSGHLIRTWDALNPNGKANVPLSASKQQVSSLWDAYHLNSVQALPDGDLLISMRNTWAVYLIDPVTDTTVWTLGGKQSTFALGKGTSFSWQHDARLVSPAQGGLGTDVELTLFDDNSTTRAAKGLFLRLDTTTDQATLVDAYRHHPPLSVAIMGSMQLLPNGNALVGWGSEPYFTEYSPSGSRLLDVKWPDGDNTYRALFTDTWVGTPYYPPRAAVRAKTVYASWNGATGVAKWQVLAGANTKHLKVVASKRRGGFETAIALRQRYGSYEVRALNASGAVLGTSRAF